MLSVRVAESQGWTVIALSGEIDLATAPELRQAIVTEVAAGHNHLVVDLTDVSFIDSSGLGVLIGGLKRVRGNGGDLALTGLTRAVRRVFELTRLDAAIAIVDDVASLAPPVATA